jgi:RimJ/RimL family protein N-acetyltransferase
MNVAATTLTGRFVELVPLRLEHLDALCGVGLDPDLWRVTLNKVHDRAGMERYVRTALDAQTAGVALPFTIIAREPGGAVVVGCTRYHNIDAYNRRVEIGYTWVARRWQRTPINTEAKYLLLRHAFEALDCVRVEFKTDRLNERSRTALKRIGAKEEGIFRRHMLTDDGRWRDTVYYSILAEEWPGVRDALELMLGPRTRGR